MKNSKNKIIASLVCGIIIGSVGTSVLTTTQTYTQASELPDMTQENSPKDIPKGEENMGQPPRRKKGHSGSGDLEVSEGIDVSNSKYSDGVYEGEANAYAPNMKVQVTVADGLISNIEIVSHNETPGFYEGAFELVPQAIINSQSTEVDTVSGATYTSVGIMNAVNDALEETTSNIE